MKAFFKNRIALAVLCMIMAAILCFVITPLYNGVLNSKVDIIRVTAPIKEHQLIDSTMITKISVGGYNLPADVILDAEDIIGKYAQTDLYKDDYILKSKISDTPLGNNSYLEALDENTLAISITIKSFAAGLSDKLMPGDIVTLIATKEDGAAAYIPDELQYMQILAVTSTLGEDITNTTKNEENTEAKNTTATLTLCGVKEQAKLLAELEHSSVLHCALVSRGDKAAAQELINKQKMQISETAKENNINKETIE